MEDEAARPLRSSEQLEARMCELKRLVASELLSADDVAVEVAQLRAEARAWLLRTAAADVLSYNYAVRYDADDEQQHWLTEPRYVGSNNASAENDWSGMDAHPPGSWAVFTTSVLPRAPQAGRTTALRAAPPEIIALGGAEQRRRL